MSVTLEQEIILMRELQSLQSISITSEALSIATDFIAQHSDTVVQSRYTLCVALGRIIAMQNFDLGNQRPALLPALVPALKTAFCTLVSTDCVLHIDWR